MNDKRLIRKIRELIEEHRQIQKDLNNLSDINLLNSKVNINKEFYQLIAKLSKMNYDLLGIIIENVK